MTILPHAIRPDDDRSEAYARATATRAIARVLIALSLTTLLPVIAGCGADGVQVINDPFLGPTRGFVMYLDASRYAGVSAKEVQGKYTLQVMVGQVGDSLAVGRVGDKTDFLVGNDVVTLENTAEARPVANVTNHTAFGQMFTQWQLTFTPDAQQAAHFASGPLKAIKIRVGAQEYLVELSAAKAAKFQANMSLLASAPIPSTAPVTTPGASVAPTAAP